MALRLKAWAMAWMALSLTGLGQAAELPAPQGLTIRAGSNGVLLLLWDPMQRDDLMGYSIWKRPEGKGEYTRVSVPVKRGQEVVKLPLTTKASFLFKDKPGVLSELRVAAEFEDGRGPASATVSTRRAKRVAEALGGAAPAGPGPSPTAEAVSSTEINEASPTPSPSAQATPDEEARIKVMEDSGVAHDAPQPYLGAFPKPGRFRSSLDFVGNLEQTTTRGSDFLVDESNWSPQFGPGRPWDASSQFATMQGRASLSLGLGAQTSISAALGWMGASERWSDFNVSGVEGEWEGAPSYQIISISDLRLSFLMRPVPKQPIYVDLGFTLPTGQSRFRSFCEGFWDLSRVAGTGVGVVQSRAELSWGAQTAEPGNRFSVSYQPSSSEVVDIELYQGFKIRHEMTRGAVTELRLGRGFPWHLRGRAAMVHVAALARSSDPGKASISGYNLKDFDKLTINNYRSATGAGLEREDQVGGRVEYWQALGLGIWTRGIFEARLKPNGYVIEFTGGLVY